MINNFIFCFFLFVSCSSFAACFKPVSRETISKLMKMDASPVVTFDCKVDCVCVDEYPYPIDTEGLKMGDLQQNTLTVNAKKKADKDALDQIKANQESALREELATLRVKLESETLTAAETRRLLKLYLKLKGE